MAANSKQALPLVMLGKDYDKTFLNIKNLYDFFSPRTQNITVWSVGLYRGGFEVTFAESTGATVHIFDSRPEAKETFEIVKRVTNTHETQQDDPEWATTLSNQWILPDTLIFHDWVPWCNTATIDISGSIVKSKEAEAERVDFLKVDYAEFTSQILFGLLSKGYRPGLLLVNWWMNPDASNITMCDAGHLQNIGYRLLGYYENMYLYIYLDNSNMYEICSWSQTNTNNPMFDEFLVQTLNITAQAPVQTPQ